MNSREAYEITTIRGALVFGASCQFGGQSLLSTTGGRELAVVAGRQLAVGAIVAVRRKAA